MLNHGTDPARRWIILRERVLAVKEIWTKERAELHGEYVDFEPLWSWPKPVGPPPVLVGGGGPGTFAPVLEYEDGWMPLNRGDAEHLAGRVAELRKLVADSGRAPVPVTVFGATVSRGALERYVEIGVDRVLFALPSAGRDDVSRRLETLTELAADHLNPRS